MVSAEDSGWVFDSLVGFLHGPVWSLPLQTFIEENSLIFDPCPTDGPPHPAESPPTPRPEYVAVHEQYKSLVDLMLSQYMAEMCISAEQLEAACCSSDTQQGQQQGQQGQQGQQHDQQLLPLHLHRRLFTQIWAANDLDIFIRMMTQKNIELQLQALEVLESRQRGEEEQTREERERQQEESEVIVQQVKRISLEESLEAAGLYHVPSSQQEEVPEEEQQQEEAEIAGGAAAQLEQASPGQQAKPQRPDTQDVYARREYLRRQRDLLQARRNTNSSTAAPAARPDSTVATEGAVQLRRALAERLRKEVVDKA